MHTHKVVDIIDTRDSVEINKALEKYENLKLISRDRGGSYRAIEGDYVHIADRFHLIMNLSHKIASEVKRTLPHRIQVGVEEIKSNSSGNNGSDDRNGCSRLSAAVVRKSKLIEQVKELKQKGYSQKDIAKAMKLDPKTVSKYVSVEDIVSASQYLGRKRRSYLEPHADLIMNLYMENKYVVEILKELNIRGIYAKITALHDFINKRISEKAYSKTRPIYIDRKDIINYILSWSYRPMILEYIDDIFEKYKVLIEYKNFYEYFKDCLVGLRRDSLLELTEKEHSCKLIRRFIFNLKQDYEAVINSATYELNNGLLEGHVNKLKKIKRDMYGRASIDLLRKKVLYQSLVLC